MLGILVICHEPLGTALINCTRHVYGRLPPQLAALDIVPNEDPDAAVETARSLMHRINDCTGGLVLTDVFGATPSRIASRLAEPYKVEVLAGVNLPMLLKALSLRRECLPLNEYLDTLIESARSGVQHIAPVQTKEVVDEKS